MIAPASDPAGDQRSDPSDQGASWAFFYSDQLSVCSALGRREIPGAAAARRLRGRAGADGAMIEEARETKELICK